MLSLDNFGLIGLFIVNGFTYWISANESHSNEFFLISLISASYNFSSEFNKSIDVSIQPRLMPIPDIILLEKLFNMLLFPLLVCY